MEGAARTLRLNSIAAINAFVIGSFGLAIAYNLLHVDLQAIAALYQYPSGEVEEGFSKLAASLDLLARLPMDQIHSYEILVPTNPIFYKACTSGVAYTFGDFISQVPLVCVWNLACKDHAFLQEKGTSDLSAATGLKEKVGHGLS
eukprot:scaffold13154_cov101-Isochrysis_galbana.AAC.2